MDRKRQKKADALEEKKKSISLPKALTATDKGQQTSASASSSSLVRPAKKPKRTHEEVEPPLPSIPEDSAPPPPVSTAGLTALQKGMKRSLDGARFRQVLSKCSLHPFIFARLINETLYKSDSHEAHQMMRKDPKVYEEVRGCLLVFTAF
jgi:ribosomal RNA-processing protein 8